jgi:O-antigen ligase/tetratricopeptide (TPR) repeat protein
MSALFKRIIFIGSVFILFFPLFVYRLTFYPYIFPKIIAFQILVEIIFFAWLILAIYKKEYWPNFKNPLVSALTIFVGVLILTAFTGVDISRSFFSTQERMTGVLTMIHFWLWFLILSSVFKEEKDWQKMIWASLLCSFLVGLYGLGQKIGLKFLLKGDEWRMSSTLGNPIYLGVYSMLHIFLAGFLFLKERKFWRWLTLFLLLFNLIIMFLSATRGTVLAFILTTFTFVTFLIFNKKTKRQKIVLATIFILAILFLIGVYLFFQTPKAMPIKSKLPFYLYRFLDFKTFVSGIDQRTIPWQIGLGGFKERPIFGWGWENFNIIFNKYFKPQIYRWGEPSTWFDRSHNQLIDILSLTGILGAVSYLFVWLAIFWLLFRRFKKENQTRLSLIVLGLMFLAYFIQNLTVFDTPAPLIIFYFGLGLVYFTTKSNTDRQIQSNTKNVKLNSRFNRPPLPILLFLITIFPPLTIYKFNLEPFIQSRFGITAVTTIKKNLNSGLYWYKKSLAKPIFTNPEIRLQLVKSISEIYSKELANQSVFKEALDLAIVEMEKSVKEHPLDVRYWLYLVQTYNLKGVDQVEYLTKAENALSRAKKLSPKRQQIYFELAKTKLLKANYDEAVMILKEAVNLDDRVGESYWQLGVAYYFTKNYPEALRAIEKSLSLLSLSGMPDRMIMAGNIYVLNQRYREALYYYNLAQNTEPTNLEVYIKKAIVYSRLGNKEEAIRTIEKILEIDPSYKEQVDEFIKNIINQDAGLSF